MDKKQAILVPNENQNSFYFKSLSIILLNKAVIPQKNVSLHRLKTKKL